MKTCMEEHTLRGPEGRVGPKGGPQPKGEWKPPFEREGGSKGLLLKGEGRGGGSKGKPPETPRRTTSFGPPSVRLPSIRRPCPNHPPPDPAGARALQTPPKFHERTPKREKENWGGRGKNARNFGPPTLRGPTLQDPTLPLGPDASFGARQFLRGSDPSFGDQTLSSETRPFLFFLPHV